MNERVRVSAVFLLGISIMSATAAAQPAEPAAAGAPPPAGDLSSPPATAPTITTPTNTAPENAAPTTTTTTTVMAAPPASAPAPTPPPSTAVAPVKIDSPSTTIKFGFLAQPQYEAAGSVTADDLSHNLFLRRTRVLIGGTLFGVVDYFLDTDFGNLFKLSAVPATGTAPATMAKATPGMNIQDAFVTYKPLGDLVKIDAGYMLPPLSHNAVQGAGSLYGWDYFAYTFNHSAVFGSTANPVGRDLGVELRGLLLDGHIEYRAGLFQGLRNLPAAADPVAGTTAQVGGRNMFRVAARLQLNLLDAEPGFFYAGTYFGAKKILSIGGSYDFQDTYKFWAVDGIADLPLGPGVFTAQVNFAQWNASNTTFIALAKQTALVGEVGYTISALHLSPIFRYEQLWGTDAPPVGPADQKRIAGGLAFWPYLHNTNVKVFYTRIMQNGAPHDANQVNVQWQVYFF